MNSRQAGRRSAASIHSFAKLTAASGVSAHTVRMSHDPSTSSILSGGTFSTRVSPSRGETMANKDKGGSKSSKTVASKSLKEKRRAKKTKAARSGSSSMGTSTNK